MLLTFSGTVNDENEVVWKADWSIEVNNEFGENVICVKVVVDAIPYFAIEETVEGMFIDVILRL